MACSARVFATPRTDAVKCCQPCISQTAAQPSAVPNVQDSLISRLIGLEAVTSVEAATDSAPSATMVSTPILRMEVIKAKVVLIMRKSLEKDGREECSPAASGKVEKESWLYQDTLERGLICALRWWLEEEDGCLNDLQERLEAQTAQTTHHVKEVVEGQKEGKHAGVIMNDKSGSAQTGQALDLPVVGSTLRMKQEEKEDNVGGDVVAQPGPLKPALNIYGH